MAATNKLLHAEVAAGKFREDLLYRIEVFTIEIPSLRQRREDIPELAEHLLKHLANKYGRQTLLLRAEDLVALQGYSFPGNVRELRNILERGLLRTADESRWLSLDLAWLKVSEPRPPIIASPVTASTVPTGAILDDALPTDRASLSPLEAQEYRMIRTALREVNGGIRRAAAKVGLSPQALLRRLEKWPELRTGEK